MPILWFWKVILWPMFGTLPRSPTPSARARSSIKSRERLAASSTRHDRHEAVDDRDRRRDVDSAFGCLVPILREKRAQGIVRAFDVVDHPAVGSVDENEVHRHRPPLIVEAYGHIGS